MKKILIILAGGKGERFKQDKTMVELQKKPLITWSLETFYKSREIDEFYVISNKKNHNKIKKIVPNFVKIYALAGKTRAESAKNAIKKIKPKKNDLLIIHNVANPLVSVKEIKNCLKQAKKYGACGVAHQTTNTIRNKNGIIPRKNLHLMETPQAIKANIYLEGLKKIKKTEEITDDLMIAEKTGVKIKIIPADINNKKITFPEDLEKMEFLLQKKEKKTFKNLFNFLPSTKNIKIGIGHDSHQFDKTGICVLGGIKFKECKKLKGNSDGDACFHALTNAILSAIGHGSLSLFSDEMCKKGIKNSQKYLERALKMLKKEKYKIKNISLSFECLKPKLEKKFPEMKKKISKILNIKEKNIGLTATSGEKLTNFGQGKGVQVFATVLIQK